MTHSRDGIRDTARRRARFWTTTMTDITRPPHPTSDQLRLASRLIRHNANATERDAGAILVADWLGKLADDLPATGR